jgi:hypothetical protein
MVLRTCEQVEGGLPADVKSKMYVNIILDFGIGLCPIIGDMADALFRANTRNAVVLEKFLRAKGAKNLEAQGHRVPTIDPTDPDEFDRFEEEQVNGPPPPYTGEPPTRQGTQRIDHAHGRSTPQHVLDESRGGWFSGFGRKKKQPDVERGTDPRRREDEPLPSLPNSGPRRDKSTLQKTRR